MKNGMMNGTIIGAPRGKISAVTMSIEQGFEATVQTNLAAKQYGVMLKCGGWTYGPAFADIETTAKKLGTQDTKRLLAYAIKSQALRELSDSVIQGTKAAGNA